jgi:hypothetical protein
MEGTPMADQPTPTMTCRKCGGEDIATAWHVNGWDCTFSQRQRYSGPDLGEHLHRSCRTCGFDWYDGTQDAKP